MIKFYNIPLLTAGGMIYDYNDPKKDFDDEFHLLVNAGYSFYQIGEFFFRNKSSPEENKSVFQRYVIKSVQVIIHLHIFPIFSFLAKYASEP